MNIVDKKKRCGHIVITILYERFCRCVFQAENETSRKVCQGDDNGDDKGDVNSTPKRPCLDSDDILHSTPVRRSSSELFDSGCTPIPAGKRAEGSASGSEQMGTEFVTPKRPPLRRLSTNTESALRHAVLTTETRVGSWICCSISSLVHGGSTSHHSNH